MALTTKLALVAFLCGICSSARVLHQEAESHPEGTLLLSQDTQAQLFWPRLLLWHNQQWGTVCLDNFTIYDAQAACAQIYSGNGAVFTTGIMGPAGAPTDPSTSGLPSWGLKSGCVGDELSLESCPGVDWATLAASTDASCADHTNDVALGCSMEQPPPPTTPGTVRLLSHADDGSEGQRLEVYADGAWGTVCHKDFSFADAGAVCAEVYGSDGQVYTSGQAFAAGTSPAELSGVPSWSVTPGCTADDVSLANCTGVDWESVTPATDAFCTDHANDVNILCAIAGEANSPPPPKPPKAAACKVESSCAGGVSGKQVNVCDKSHRTYAVCKDGKFLRKEQCWKGQLFDGTTNRCGLACVPRTECGVKEGESKEPNGCDPSNRTFLKCVDGVVVDVQKCWKQQVYIAALGKCVAPCDPSKACSGGYTGKAANTCDFSGRSFVVCKAGALVEQQTCWKKQRFNQATRKCSG